MLRRERKNEDLPVDDEHAEMRRVHGWLDDNSKMASDGSVNTAEPSAAMVPRSASDSATYVKTDNEIRAAGFLEAHDADPSGSNSSVTGGSEKGQPFSQLQLADDEGDAEEWLDEDPSSSDAGLGTHAVAEEDVSFSDLEDDDTCVTLSAAKVEGLGPSIAQLKTVKASSEPHISHRAGVEKPDRLESDDWLTVNEEDLASADSS